MLGGLPLRSKKCLKGDWPSLMVIPAQDVGEGQQIQLLFSQRTMESVLRLVGEGPLRSPSLINPTQDRSPSPVWLEHLLP